MNRKFANTRKNSQFAIIRFSQNRSYSIACDILNVAMHVTVICKHIVVASKTCLGLYWVVAGLLFSCDHQVTYAMVFWI